MPVGALRRRLARGAVGAFVVNIAGTGLAFVAQIVLARVLGADGFGVYSYVIAWVSLLAIVTTLGFQDVLLRFASVYHAAEEWGALRGLTRYAETRVVLAGLAVGVGTATVVILAADHMRPDLVRTFVVAAVIIPLLALLIVRGSLARAFGLVVIALAPYSVVRHATVFILVGLFGLVVPSPVGPELAMATMLCGTALGLAAVSAALRRSRPAPMLNALPRLERAGEWRRTAGPFLAIAGIQMLLARTGILMLGWLADTTLAGIYAAVAGVAGLVVFVLTAVNTIFAPSIATLHARGDLSGLQSMVTTTARWTTAAAVATALPLFALAESVLWVFGPEFVAGANGLRILLVGQAINAATGSVGALLGMTGHERRVLAVLGATAVVQVCLHLALIPAFGLIGAATAAATTIAGSNLTFAVLVWRQLGIIPGVIAGR